MLGQRGHFGIMRTADRDLLCIDLEQRLYLLFHGLHLSTVNLKKKVSHVMLTQGRGQHPLVYKLRCRDRRLAVIGVGGGRKTYVGADQAPLVFRETRPPYTNRNSCLHYS